MGNAVDKLTLRGLLSKKDRFFSEESLLSLVLTAPGCWPADETLASAARAGGFAPPPPPRLGETCLVSTLGGEAALWLLTLDREASKVEMVRSARDTASHAWQLALSDLPELRTYRSPDRPPPWRVLLLAKTGGPAPEFLDGPSFGLALFLASASVLVELAVPAHLLALGEVTFDGRVKPVGGLSEKLEVITSWAAGVTRLLVANDQKKEVKDLLASLGSSISVVPVTTLSQAFNVAFPERAQRALGGWRDEARARETLDQIYKRILGGKELLLGWSAIAGTARNLEGALAHDEEAVWRAHFIHAVARRNDNQELEVIEWPPDDWLKAQFRRIRLHIVAQVVQSANDGCAPDLLDRVERARTFTAAGSERDKPDSVVTGAIGRALAAAGELDQALTELEEAVTWWFEVYEPDGASFPLSEMLRVLGVLRRGDEVDRALETHVRRLMYDHGVRPISRAYVACAAGRALIQCGRVEEGLAWLDDEGYGWDQTHRPLQRSRQRWRARALEALGKREGADKARQTLEENRDVYAVLADLDRVLARGGDPEPILRELERDRGPGEADRGPELRRIIGEKSPLDRRAAELAADRWRY